MADLISIPLQDKFETFLTQELSSTGLLAYLNSVGDFTFPAGETTTLVLNPGKSNMEVVPISAVDTSAKTFTIDSRNAAQGNGTTTTAQTHAVGSKVIISDNYQFWLAIQTAINSKADSAGDTFTGAVIISGSTSYLQLPSLTTAERTALGADGMMVYDSDDNLFYQYKGGAWASIDTGTTTPNGSDTVAGVWEGATVAEQGSQSATGGTGAGLVLQPKNLVKTSSGAGDENKIAILDSTGKFASGFVPAATITAQAESAASTSEIFENTDDGNLLSFKDSSDEIRNLEADKKALHSYYSPREVYGFNDLKIGASSENDLGTIYSIANAGGANALAHFFFDTYKLSGSGTAVLSVHDKNPEFYCNITYDAATAQDGFIGFVDEAFNGASVENNVMTLDHFGFIIQDGAIIGSCADGTTQSTTSAFGSNSNGDVQLYASFDGTTATFIIAGDATKTLNTNVPDGDMDSWACAVISDATAAVKLMYLKKTVKIGFDKL